MIPKHGAGPYHHHHIHLKHKSYHHQHIYFGQQIVDAQHRLHRRRRTVDDRAPTHMIRLPVAHEGTRLPQARIENEDPHVKPVTQDQRQLAGGRKDEMSAGSSRNGSPGVAVVPGQKRSIH